MLTWHTYAVILIPGLGLWACQRRAAALLVACSFGALTVFSLDWRVALASWLMAQLGSILLTLRAHE